MDRFLLLLSKDESYLVKVSERVMNTKSGIINLSQLKRKKIGEKIKTHTGKEFVIVEPKVTDFMKKKLRRGSQVVLPKDAS
ncbi:MAG TPA: tRNA methyltransferase, partial [Candidatus Aenigmarchaeota archaeon]|nr:tRNA methyltransferase [Candidatus Aenigmarchaeota archaeon]